MKVFLERGGLPERLLARWTAGLILALAAAAVWTARPALAQEALSPALSDNLGDPLYTESSSNGPSSTLVPGAANLTDPSIRTGISDPLSSLIETGWMSPYLLGRSNSLSSSESEIHTQPLNDPHAALGANEYRDNRSLMAGTVSSGSLTGQARAAGGTTVESFGARAAQSSSFGRGSMLVPFAAGSSVVARRGGESPLSVALSGAGTDAVGTAAVPALPGPAGDGADGAGEGSQVPGFGSSLPGSMFGNMLGTATSSSAAGLASSTVAGFAPVQTAPILSRASVSGTGFEDSTMGTAGLAAESASSYASPGAPRLPDSEGSPFRELSSPTTSFLNPTLRGTPLSTAPRRIVSIEELARQARMKAMINNSSAPLPGPFQRRDLERSYRAQQQRGRPRRPGTVPTIVPNQP